MATEKRLIDVTPIIDECKECSAIEWNKSVYTTWAEAEEDFMQRLLDAPTVDAVEVSEYGAIVDKLECLLCHATGGRYSRARYSIEDMERMVNDYIEECCEEAVSENVVHGRWLYDSGSGKHFCSACDEYALSFKKDTICGGELYEVCLTDYCPNCGAKMDGGGND